MIVKRNFRQATAILTADWHAIELGSNPPCRKDDYMTAFTDKVGQIKKLQELHRCPILNAGDIFDHWKPSPELINHCCIIFPKNNWTVAGNHDLPQHNIDLFDKSGYACLNYAGAIEHMDDQISWNENPDKWQEDTSFFNGKLVAMIHKLTWKDEKPYPGCKEPGVDDIFDMFPEADLIVTGDNHKTFTARRGNQLLINPGSLMRRRGDQINHRPCVFLWFAETNSYKIHYLKIDKKAVSRNHIEKEKELQSNKELFLGKLGKEISFDSTFKDTLQKAIGIHGLSKPISKYVLKWAKL